MSNRRRFEPVRPSSHLTLSQAVTLCVNRSDSLTPPAQAVRDSTDRTSVLWAPVAACTCLTHIPDGGLILSAWITRISGFYFLPDQHRAHVQKKAFTLRYVDSLLCVWPSATLLDDFIWSSHLKRSYTSTVRTRERKL